MLGINDGLQKGGNSIGMPFELDVNATSASQDSGKLGLFISC